MGLLLQSCLAEKIDQPQPELDQIIESIDDYLHNKTTHPPIVLLKKFLVSEQCSIELKNIILESLNEIESQDGKK